MIDTRSQYIIHNEKETKLLHQIERKLAAQERGEYAETRQPWYSAAEQWLKEKYSGYVTYQKRVRKLIPLIY